MSWHPTLDDIERRPDDGPQARRSLRGGAKTENLPLLAGDGCWCGRRCGHDWPGRSDGAPHPREPRDK